MGNLWLFFGKCTCEIGKNYYVNHSLGHNSNIAFATSATASSSSSVAIAENSNATVRLKFSPLFFLILFYLKNPYADLKTKINRQKATEITNNTKQKVRNETKQNKTKQMKRIIGTKVIIF